ncbi:MAG TPA: thioredoxin [Epsilonproteobacteria bacterium]|nr:thioredoxin [Campylobacterota bacterium]
MKYFTLLLILTLNIFAAGRPLLPATPYSQIEDKIGKGAPYFLEVGSDACRSCRVMGKMLYTIKEANPKLNIYFINVHEEREVAATLKIMMIPTQLIFDAKGKEVYRHIGKLEQAELEQTLTKYGVK